MPTQLLSIGVPWNLTQNVTYALPTKPCVVTTSAACETSINGSTWTAFTSGSTSTAKFIRSAGVNTLVTCSQATGGGGSATIPKPLVLNSPVAGEPGIVLIDESAGVDQRRYHIWSSGAFLNIDAENDSGSQVARVYMKRNGDFVSNAVMQAIIMIISRALTMFEGPLANLAGVTDLGSLANISDSTVNTIGSTVVGGGANHVLARYNGSVWKVIGV